MASHRPRRYLKAFLELVASFWLNMCPSRAMANPFVPETVCVRGFHSDVFGHQKFAARTRHISRDSGNLLCGHTKSAGRAATRLDPAIPAWADIYLREFV